MSRHKASVSGRRIEQNSSKLLIWVSHNMQVPATEPEGCEKCKSISKGAFVLWTKQKARFGVRRYAKTSHAEVKTESGLRFQKERRDLRGCQHLGFPMGYRALLFKEECTLT